MNHTDLVASYNNISLVHDSLSEYSKALASYKRTRDIRESNLLKAHPDIATSYNNIGNVYFQINDYSKTLSSRERCLQIRKAILLTHHPHLADCYILLVWCIKNCGGICKNSHISSEEGLEIREKSLPVIHSEIVELKGNVDDVRRI